LKQCEEAGLGLIVASANRSEALQLVKADLDEVSDTVELAVERQSAPSLGLRVDDSLDPTRFDLGTELIGVVTGVGDERVTVCVVKQLRSSHHLVPLARSQRDVKRPAFRVDDRVDLG
jgi:hypothetical protein